MRQGRQRREKEKRDRDTRRGTSVVLFNRNLWLWWCDGRTLQASLASTFAQPQTAADVQIPLNTAASNWSLAHVSQRRRGTHASRLSRVGHRLNVNDSDSSFDSDSERFSIREAGSKSYFSIQGARGLGGGRWRLLKEPPWLTDRSQRRLACGRHWRLAAGSKS